MSDVEIAPIRSGETFDLEAVRTFLTPRASELELLEAPGAVEAMQFPGGHANLTYWIRFGGREYVLRRPPLGPVGPGAHDMGREYKVLSVLWRVFDRAPRAFVFCDDPAVIGAPFFVMERREGVVIRTEIPRELRHHRDVERRTSFALVDAMADFHDVDYRAIGLEDLGRPVGFLERQLAGWAKRWELAKDRDLADFDRLLAWLEAHKPAASRATLVHNDLKLDNCQFDPSNPDRVAALFDWDMTTLGDPLFDLGTLLGYWSEAQQPGGTTGSNAIMGEPGFPSRDEVAEHYAKRTGVDLAAIDWYEAFALWKTAVVVQQIFIRYKRGQTSDERFAEMGERVPVLLALGMAVTRKS